MITVREIHDDEMEYWNREIQRFESAHPLNAYGWGSVRTVDSWTPVYLVAEKDGEFKGGLMILVKKIPSTPYTIFYGQRGPVCDFDDREVLRKIIGAVKELARKRRAIFLRVDPSIPETFIDERENPFLQLGFRHLEQRWTFWNSPRDVSRIDLTRVETADDFLKLLHRDTRRCIRKAAREGVSIVESTKKEQLVEFYRIFSSFTVGKGFMSRALPYQLMLWEQYVVPGHGRLFLAIYKEQIIGGLICIMFGNKCLAMHMGTPYEYQKLQTYYAYVWEGIRWAKENGCEWFSFRGVGTTPSQESFKKKFKPEPVALTGYYDLPFRRIPYTLFYFAEFTLLPRAWPFLIRLRKLYHRASGILGKRRNAGS